MTQFNPRFGLVAGALFCLAAAPIVHAAPATNSLHWQPLMEPGSGGAMTDVSVCPWDSKRILVAGDMLGVGVSLDQGNSWSATTGFKTWEMASFTWHPTRKNEVWVGSMSGPYKSSDGGKTWQQKRAGMLAPVGFGYSIPIEKVVFDPTDSAHLLAVGGSSRHWDFTGNPPRGIVWESRDGGESWARLSTITADGSSPATDAKGVNITWAAFAPGSSSLLYACADEAGFLCSTDGGHSWTKRNDGLPLTDHRIALHPNNAQILWASVDNTLPDGAKERVPGGVFKTVDGGLHWTPSSTGLGQVITGTDANKTSRYRALAVAPSNPNLLYCNDGAWTTGTSYKSEDGGATWRAVVSKGNIGIANEDPAKRAVFQLETACPAGLALAGIAVDPRDPNATYGFNTETIARTLDGGKSWNDATSQKMGDGWRGRGFAGWVSVNFNFNPWKRGQSVLQGMDASRAWVSSDDLKSWTQTLGEPDPWGGGRDASFSRDGTIYATTGTFNFTGVARSTDTGKTWTVLHGKERGLPDFYSGNAPGGVYVLPDNSQKVWAVVNDKLMASQDGGNTWKIALDKPGLRWICADLKKPSRFFVTGKRNIYMTDDGANFLALGGPHTRDCRLAVDSLGRLLVAARNTERPGLWRCDVRDPKNPVWTRLSDESEIRSVAVSPTDPNRLVFSTNQDPFTEVSAATGVWCSSDSGKSWSQQNDGLAMLRGDILAVDPFVPTRLVFGTSGRGFWTANWPQTLNIEGAHLQFVAR